MSEKDYLSINNYELKQDIGEGNFGKVKLGIFKKTGEQFAIKIINKDKIKQKMNNILFKENEIITKFNHINIVYVFQIIEEEKNIYIIMEYCNQGELFDYIVAHQKLEEDEASIFFYQLINGVDYIHKKGVAHRDLKPENLLLTVDKILKIIDFGLSHEYDENSLLKTKCGSPSYAAPEIIKGKLYDGFKTDIWCCGIILYAMLCGYLPFEGENNRELFRSILQCNPEYPPFLSKTSKKLIQSLLRINPNERLTIEEIKQNDFYLKGKELCKIDYKSVEDELEKRNTFYGDGNKKFKNIFNINNKKIEQEETLSKISNNNNNNNTKINIINLITDVNSNGGAINTFRQRVLKNNDNFKKKIELINDKIQKILQTDANESNNKINNNEINNLKRINLFNYKKNNIDNLIGKQNKYNERFQNKNTGYFLYLKKVNKNSINSIENTAYNSHNKTKKFFTQFVSPIPTNKKTISPFIYEYNKNNMNNYKNTETINFNNKYYNDASMNNNSNDTKTLNINKRNCEISPIHGNLFNNIKLDYSKINKINSVENKNRTKKYINYKNDYPNINLNNKDIINKCNKDDEINSKNSVVNNINTIWNNNSDYKKKNLEDNVPTYKNLQTPNEKYLHIPNLVNKYNNNSPKKENKGNNTDNLNVYENINKNKKNKNKDLKTLNTKENIEKNNKDNIDKSNNNTNSTFNYRSKSRDNGNNLIKNLKEKFNNNNILPPLDIRMKINH